MKALDSFTVERLEELIKSASLEPCDAEPIYDNVQVREIAALARIALAAKSGDLFIGMDIGVDVSTCEADSLNRYYGTVTEVSELETKKNGVILLVQDAEPNFATTPQLNSPEIPDERLIALANHIQSSLGGLPDEWQSWADEIVSDLRKYAAPEKP